MNTWIKKINDKPDDGGFHHTYFFQGFLMFEEVFAQHDFSQYQDAKIIVKGCGKLPIPTQAYCNFIAKLKPYASSIMFGEPCSAVPLYKKPKN